MSRGSLIVLMTDFGTVHWFDAVMKGEILRRAPDAIILDLSHEVPRHAIEQGAFQLHCAVDSFPARTIFLCVVDPGVGSERRTLCGWVGDYGYVGPDNGLVTPLLQRADPNEVELHQIKTPTFLNQRVSRTFHGRDIFAPAAARLYLGDDPRMAGPRVTDPVRLPDRSPKLDNGRVEGRVMLIDHFGNAITNIEADQWQAKIPAGRAKLRVRTLELADIETNYSSKKPGTPLGYWGSSRTLEIAVNFGSAAETFGIQIGDPVTIEISD